MRRCIKRNAAGCFSPGHPTTWRHCGANSAMSTPTLKLITTDRITSGLLDMGTNRTRDGVAVPQCKIRNGLPGQLVGLTGPGKNTDEANHLHRRGGELAKEVTILCL